MRDDTEGKANLQEHKNLKQTDHAQTDINKKPTGADNTHVCHCKLAATYVCNTRSCNTL